MKMEQRHCSLIFLEVDTFYSLLSRLLMSQRILIFFTLGIFYTQRDDEDTSSDLHKLEPKLKLAKT
jgi:hypothetical protein